MKYSTYSYLLIPWYHPKYHLEKDLLFSKLIKRQCQFGGGISVLMVDTREHQAPYYCNIPSRIASTSEWMSVSTFRNSKQTQDGIIGNSLATYSKLEVWVHPISFPVVKNWWHWVGVNVDSGPENFQERDTMTILYALVSREKTVLAEHTTTSGKNAAIR